MRELFSQNLPLKVLALVLAFSVWAGLTGQKALPRDFTVPLSIQLDATQTYAAQPPSQIRLRLTGTQSRMRSFDPSGLVASIDLRGRLAGRHEIQLGPSHVDGVPRRVTPEFIETDRVVVITDRLMRREVLVEPKFRDGPPAGLHIYAARAVPERVAIEGPASALETIDRIETDPISLADRTRPFSTTVSAAPNSPMVTVLGDSAIDVRVVVDDQPVERDFGALPVVVVGGVGDNDRVTIKPRDVRVELTGPPQLLDRLSPSQIRVGVDLADVPSDGRSQRVTVAAEVLELPAEQLQRIRIKALRPGQVSVRVDPGAAADADDATPGSPVGGSR